EQSGSQRDEDEQPPAAPPPLLSVSGQRRFPHHRPHLRPSLNHSRRGNSLRAVLGCYGYRTAPRAFLALLSRAGPQPWPGATLVLLLVGPVAPSQCLEHLVHRLLVLLLASPALPNCQHTQTHQQAACSQRAPVIGIPHAPATGLFR